MMRVILDTPEVTVDEKSSAFLLLKELAEFSSKKENHWDNSMMRDPKVFSRIVKMHCHSGKHEHEVRVVFTWTVAKLQIPGSNKLEDVPLRHASIMMDGGRNFPEASIIVQVGKILGFQPDFHRWNTVTHDVWPGAVVIVEPAEYERFKDKPLAFAMTASPNQQPQEEFFPSFNH